MQKKYPLVSIIIPVYNGSNYLKEAIDSAINQTYENIEILVINDGSNDNGETENIVFSYGNKVKYFKKDNEGVASALNMGIRMMSGLYFSWLSHDDLYKKNKIKSQIDFIQENDLTNVILFSDFEVLDVASNLKTSSKIPDNIDNFRYWITKESSLHGCTLLIPKTCFDQIGLFNEKLLTTQDYDLWFRFAGKYKFIKSPGYNVLGRHHPAQTTNFMPNRVYKECNLFLLSSYNKIKNELSDEYKEDLQNSFIKRKFYYAYYSVLYARSRGKLKKTKNHFLKTLSRYPTLFQRLKRIYSLNLLRGKKQSVKGKFIRYYNNNSFNSEESRSGEGSTMQQTMIIRQEIPLLLKKYHIKRLLDAPCGDFNWMKYVDLTSVEKYIGLDIVDDLVARNNVKFGNCKFKFKVSNIIGDDLPAYDMILCRDCLVHLNHKDAIDVIKNIKRNGIRYLLTTTFTERTENYDLSDAEIWRPLNLQLSPFHFPNPLEEMNEGCTEAQGLFMDKTLSLYDVDEINL